MLGNSSSCFFSRPISTLCHSFNILNTVLLAPLCSLIIHHGFQQWTRKPSSSSSSSSASPSDVLSYHTVAMELLRVLGSCVFCRGIGTEDEALLIAGHLILFFTWFGETFFHLLTCLERYLAVVHPVTYRRLRAGSGTRIRNVSMAFVWLVCAVEVGLAFKSPPALVVNSCLVGLSFWVVSYCSLSVLRVLVRPGPGEPGRKKERLEGVKKQALFTMVSILGVLVLRFSWCLASLASRGLDCPLQASGLWLSLPSGMLAPLLFLHRKGKLLFWRRRGQ